MYRNREILNQGWHKTEVYIKYKARKLGKVVFKIGLAYTSQECTNCAHTHPKNREGINLKCVNAGKIIKKRAIKLLMDSGTELSDIGVLRLSDIGRRAKIRPSRRNSTKAQAKNGATQRKRQKRKEVAA